ncbi:MAG: alpha amylase C-terminal domain-containing protein, partial [Oscillospiraceae bacterium]
SWKVYDTTHAAETEAYESYNYITKTGEVIRPRWFEGDKSFKAIGTIRSGNATFEKELSLVVQAQDAPNLNAENFNGFIDIGNSESENAHKFDIVRGSNIKRNIVDNQILAYRTLKKDGAMLINLECDPTATNYITIKLWGGDRGSGTLFIAEPNADLDYSGEIPRRTKALEINEMSDAPQFEGGFIYYTYEVPQEYTNGKNNVSLALYSRGGYEKGDSRLLKEQKSDSRGIYACYMTTSPNFNPDDFKEFGEVETAGSATIPPPKYSLANSEELTRQHDKMIENIQAALKTVKMRQVYNDKNYPIYLDGMTTNSTAWKADVFNDSENSKDIYYADMLSDDMSSLNILRIFATAYENYDELMLSEAEKSELLDRIIIAIDFLVRAQGSNGGFSDTDEKWIGGPNRAPATETEFKNGLLSAVYAANMISDSIVSYKYLEKSIDSDGDGVQDIERRTAWANMFTSMRDYYSADTSRGNIALRLAANLNISQLNNDLAYDINTVESLINAGLKANVPAILKSESVNDYNSDSLVIAGDIANMARRYYFKGNTDKIKAFDTAVSNLYSMVDKYYSIANTHSTTSTVYTELFGDGRNKTETLHYPIDVYAMTVLANPTALKIAEIYLTHGNFEEKELFYSDNKNYYENILDISAMCFNYHDILKNVKQYDISNYSFLMDDVKIDNYAWVDNNTLSIVVKNNDDKIFMSLGKNVTASGDVSMLFHHTTKNYDKHSSAKIFEDWIEPDARGLTHVDYGKYKIISNSSATKSYKLPTSLNLTGTYKDLISGTYYTFGNSSSVTTKVVPTDAALVVGSEVNIPPLTTLVLYGE